MKLSLTPLLILLFIAIKSFSQETKEVIEESGSKNSRVKLQYNVLKDNARIKHGPYKVYITDELAISGFYKLGKKDSVWYGYNSIGSVISKKTYNNNKRTGTWEFYNQYKEVVWKYDFNKDSFTNRPKDFSEYGYAFQSPKGKWYKGYHADSDPIWLRSLYEWQSFVRRVLRYPQVAIDSNTVGKISVEIALDENGTPLDYSIGYSDIPSLNKESLRLVKLFEPEFLPAKFNGKRVKSKVRIPIVITVYKPVKAGSLFP